MLLIICTATVLGLSELFLHARMEKVMVSSVDRMLHSKLQLFTGLLHEEHGKVEFEGGDMIAGEYVVPRSGHYYSVFMDGILLAASESLAGHDIKLPPANAAISYEKLPSGPVYFDSVGPDNEPLRVLRYIASMDGRRFDIILAEGLKPTNSAVSEFRWILFSTDTAVILLLAFASWAVSKHSLNPLKKFSSYIGSISEKNLDERIDSEKAASELHILAESFNSMLDRLSLVIESQKRLVADASHELKTPISVIKSQCDVTLQRARNAEEYISALKNIDESTKGITRLINDLLSLAILDSGIVSGELNEPVSIADCVDEALQLTRPYALDSGVKVTVSVDRLLRVSGSASSLKEAFLNLIENGIKYNRPDGMVSIYAIAKGGGIVITVADSGIGIEPELQSRVFERFYRVDNQRGTEGTGLGLSIVKSIIEMHNGSISLVSTPGVGSCFTIMLPRRSS